MASIDLVNKLNKYANKELDSSRFHLAQHPSDATLHWSVGLCDIQESDHKKVVSQTLGSSLFLAKSMQAAFYLRSLVILIPGKYNGYTFYSFFSSTRLARWGNVVYAFVMRTG